MGILLNKSKNYVINGALDFWQRGTSFASIANGAYFADRFQYTKNATAVHTITQDTTDIPTLAESGFTFPSSARIQLITPQATFTTNQFVNIDHKIEGQIFTPLLNKPITISFWVKASLVGVYPYSLRNGALDRSYVTTFTVNAANTWEKKIITIQHDNTGVWNTSNGIGAYSTINLASGPTLQAPSLNVWLAGGFVSHSSCVNGAQSGATNFRIAGVQLEEGTTASNFERAGGNTLNEMTLCQRYYEVNLDSFRVWVASAGDIRTIFYKATKRTTPNITYSTVGGGVVGTINSNGVNQLRSIYSNAATGFYGYLVETDAEL